MTSELDGVIGDLQDVLDAERHAIASMDSATIGLVTEQKLELTQQLSAALENQPPVSTPEAKKELAVSLAKIRRGAEINRILLHDAHDMVVQIRVRPEPQGTYNRRACAAKAAATPAANTLDGPVVYRSQKVGTK